MAFLPRISAAAETLHCVLITVYLHCSSLCNQQSVSIQSHTSSFLLLRSLLSYHHLFMITFVMAAHFRVPFNLSVSSILINNNRWFSFGFLLLPWVHILTPKFRCLAFKSMHCMPLSGGQLPQNATHNNPTRNHQSLAVSTFLPHSRSQCHLSPRWYRPP